MASDCDCGPPPEFILPPPPSPELFWDLAPWSDGPSLELDSCLKSDLNGLCLHQVLNQRDNNIWTFGQDNDSIHGVDIVPDTILKPVWALALAAILAVAVIFVLLCVLGCKRRAASVRSGSSHGLSKLSHSTNQDSALRTSRSDVHKLPKGTNNTQWAYAKHSTPKHTLNGLQSVNGSSLGTLQLGVTSQPIQPQIQMYESRTQPRTQIVVDHPAQAVYDEIGQGQSTFQMDQTPRRHNRLPAPQQPPPPPPGHPLQGAQCSSGSSLEGELQGLQGTPSPFRAHQSQDSPPDTDIMGRESGYGTGHRAHLVTHSHTSPQLAYAHQGGHRRVVNRPLATMMSAQELNALTGIQRDKEHRPMPMHKSLSDLALKAVIF